MIPCAQKLFLVTWNNRRCSPSANMTEACMLRLGAYSWMRNSDVEPTTRMKAVIAAARNVLDAKENTGAETSIGVLSMAGDSPQVLTVLTKFMSNEFGRVYDALNVVKVKGHCEFKTSLLVAQLAMKNGEFTFRLIVHSNIFNAGSSIEHRPVKSAAQRLVVSIASPITNEVEELVQV